MGEYEHRQRGWWWLPILAIGVAMPILTGALAANDPKASGMLWPMVVCGIIVVLLALTFVHLEVRDEGERLKVRFGPLEIFGTSVLYEDIESAERMRTNLLYGLGMHGCPGWFLVCNIRGSEAVRIRLKRRGGMMMVKQVIIGTDDAENLLAFLQGKLEGPTA